MFCFDGDRAGRSAAWRALEQALPEVYEGRECVFMFLPDGQDPDTLVQEIGADEFRARIEQAPSLPAFLLSELCKQVNLSGVDGRAKLAVLARPHLARLREGPLRSLLVEELARLTRLSRQDLESALAPKSTPKESTADPLNEPGEGRPVKRALQLLLERPALVQQATDMELLAESGAPGIGLLIEALDFFRDNPAAAAAQLLELWRDTPKAAALQRLWTQPLDLAEEALEPEFRETLAHLLQKARRGRAQALVALARERELSPDELRELERLSRELSARPAG